MRSSSKLQLMLRRAAWPSLALVVMAFFGGYAVLGANGVLAYGRYTHQLEQKRAVYAALDRQREVMRNRVALLDPRHADPDMVDELTREKLNVVHPDEVVVPLN